MGKCDLAVFQAAQPACEFQRIKAFSVQSDLVPVLSRKWIAFALECMRGESHDDTCITRIALDFYPFPERLEYLIFALRRIPKRRDRKIQKEARENRLSEQPFQVLR